MNVIMILLVKKQLNVCFLGFLGVLNTNVYVVIQMVLVIIGVQDQREYRKALQRGRASCTRKRYNKYLI